MASWSLADDYHAPFVSFIHCEQNITWSAQKIHGIKASDLHDAPPLLSLWPTIKKSLSSGPVVAHGHGTEKRFLRAFPGHSFGPWIDTLQLARCAWPHLASHSLGELCSSLDLNDFGLHAPNRQWHDALYDSLASLALLKHLILTYELSNQPVSILLQPKTSIWHRLRHS